VHGPHPQSKAYERRFGDACRRALAIGAPTRRSVLAILSRGPRRRARRTDRTTLPQPDQGLHVDVILEAAHVIEREHAIPADLLGGRDERG
jgi:hypothetical protein